MRFGIATETRVNTKKRVARGWCLRTSFRNQVPKPLKPPIWGRVPNKALVRNAQRQSRKLIKGLSDELTKQWIPRDLLVYANSLKELERNCIKERVRKESPNGEIVEYLGFNLKYDNEAGEWQLKPYEEELDTPYFSVPISILPRHSGNGGATPSLTPNNGIEIDSAQLAEYSRLMAGKEAADRAKKKDDSFCNVPPTEQPDRANVSLLRLRHEDQATRS